MRAPAAALPLLAALALTACSRPTTSRPADPPRRRQEGPRAIPFAGGDPAAKGWVKVEGLLWIERERADAYARGLLWTGGRYSTIAEADALPKSADQGYVLRADHVVLRTNVRFARAKELVRLCEHHLVAVLDAFGEPLDLRLPADPLRIVVAARRDEFARFLHEHVAQEVEWGAFYQAADGAVYASDERRPAGGLSVAADLRHELTHAILDLGRGDAGRGAMFGRPQFWAWEAAAVWSEGLGDPPAEREGRERLARFALRRAAGQTVPLAELFALRQEDFLGRHYDETASFMAWLMDADGGRYRGGFHALLKQVMAGWGESDFFERFVGLPVAEAERRWLASIVPPK